MSMPSECRYMVAAAALLAGMPTAWATRLAPPQVIQCPGSEEIRQTQRLGSGNLLHARYWSDGYRDAPMLPDFPRITRCTEEGPIFWVSSARVLGEIPWGNDASAPAAWRGAPEVRHLTADEYLLAIRRGLGDTADRLFELRLRAWWATNQVGRGQRMEIDPFPAGGEARANLESLLALFDGSRAEHLLMKADALRELGRFDEAAQVLEDAKLREPRLLSWIRHIREGIQQRNTGVLELDVGQ